MAELGTSGISITAVKEIAESGSNKLSELYELNTLNKWSVYRPHKWDTARDNSIEDAKCWRVIDEETVKTTKEITDNQQVIESMPYYLGDFRKYSTTDDSKNTGIKITNSPTGRKISQEATIWDIDVYYETKILSSSWFNKITGKTLSKKYVYAYYSLTQSSDTVHELIEITGSEGSTKTGLLTLSVFDSERTTYLPIYLRDVYEDSEGTFYSYSEGVAQKNVSSWTIGYGSSDLFWQYDTSFNSGDYNTDLSALKLDKSDCTITLSDTGMNLSGSLKLYSDYRTFTIGSDGFGFHLNRRTRGTTQWIATGVYKSIDKYLNWGSSSQGGISINYSFPFTPNSAYDYALELTHSYDSADWDMKAAPNPDYYSGQSIS